MSGDKSEAGTAAAATRPAAAGERLIVALDVSGTREALAAVDRLGDTVRWYKVGMELFYAEGPGVVRALRERGKRIFLDLKLHDIPNTMAGALQSLAVHGVDLTTVHVPAGRAALEAVARAARALRAEGRPAPHLLGVTRLTSLPAPDPGRPWEDIVALGGVAVAAGLDGWVAPVEAAPFLRDAHGSGPLLVCPGIRMPEGGRDDQVSVGTPEAAVRGGADWIVAGRGVLHAPDPLEAARRMIANMS